MQAHEPSVQDAEAPHGNDVVLAGEERGISEGVAGDEVRVCDTLVRLHGGRTRSGPSTPHCPAAKGGWACQGCW
jgi:hypothetical protein